MPDGALPDHQGAQLALGLLDLGRAQWLGEQGIELLNLRFELRVLRRELGDVAQDQLQQGAQAGCEEDIVVVVGPECIGKHAGHGANQGAHDFGCRHGRLDCARA